MRSTLSLQRLATTGHGMRRVLKRPIPTVDYIRKAVQTGVYLSANEDPTTVERRHFNQRYPVEYEILSMHPLPLENPPKMPKKYLRQEELRARQANRTDRLVQSYLSKQSQDVVPTKSSASSIPDHISVDDHYRKLLGISAPAPTTRLGKKSALLNKAYAVAMKQEELLRAQGPDGMSEEEALDLVETLLKESAKEERHASRNVYEKVKEWKRDQEAAAAAAAAAAQKAATAATTTTTKDQDASMSPIHFKMDADSNKTDSFAKHNSTEMKDDDDSNNAHNSVPSILHSKPRTVAGIAIWSKKLQAVPYREWTIGAATALDHFVACSVLDVSQDTWDALLEGSDASLKSIGHDIILTRRALFPETAMVEDMERDYEQNVMHDLMMDNQDDDEEEDKSIDELLASLGAGSSTTNDKDFSWKDGPNHTTATGGGSTSSSFSNSVMDQLMEELQEWRKMNQLTPYDEWNRVDRADFQSWMEEYVKTLQPKLSSSSKDSTMDWDATRRAMLDAPPMTPQESATFWDNIRDETQAELFLESLRHHYDNRAAHAEKELSLLAPFWKLSHDEQVQRLVELSHFRPIMDEYSSHYMASFLERHAEKLLHGLELEHLVLDPNGMIRGSELKKWWSTSDITAHGSSGDDTPTTMTSTIQDTDTFSIQTLPYGSNEKARLLYEEWNTYKVGRARYEEQMFKEGKLGLRYSDKPSRESEYEKDGKKKKNTEDDD